MMKKSSNPRVDSIVGLECQKKPASTRLEPLLRLPHASLTSFVTNSRNENLLE